MPRWASLAVLDCPIADAPRCRPRVDSSKMSPVSRHGDRVRSVIVERSLAPLTSALRQIATFGNLRKLTTRPGGVGQFESSGEKRTDWPITFGGEPFPRVSPFARAAS